MDDNEFREAVQRIVQWFVPLNPYSHSGSILKIEDANYAVKDGKITEELEPLYCFAVSAKRYALFNLDRERSVLRRVSAHGLGHLYRPYKEDEAPDSVADPRVSLKDLECERWHHDLWYRIVEAALGATPEQVPVDNLPGFDAPAVSRYGATTPTLLRWFKEYNRGKPYRDQVRPFGFLLSFPAPRKRMELPDARELHERREGARHWQEQWRELRGAILHEGGIRPTAEYTSEDIPRSVLRHRGLEPDVMADLFGYDYVDPFLEHVRFVSAECKGFRAAGRRRGPSARRRPVAPFNRDAREAAASCFDRLTGEPIDAGELRSYADALAQYHLSPEHKFLNGDYLDSGITQRRHVVADTIEHIGKEADRWEEQFYLGLDLDAQIEYGTASVDLNRQWVELKGRCGRLGYRELARRSGLSHTHVRRTLRSAAYPSRAFLLRLLSAVSSPTRAFDTQGEEEAAAESAPEKAHDQGDRGEAQAEDDADRQYPCRQMKQPTDAENE
jgi:hypothetical protein